MPLSTSRAEPPWRRWGRRAAIAFAALSVLWAVLPPPPRIVESVYSRAVYPWLARPLVWIQDHADFALGVIVLTLVAMALGAGLAVVWRRCRRRGLSKRRSAFSCGVQAVVASCLVYGAFVVVWGANYRRLTIERLLGCPEVRVEPGAGELADLAGELERIIRESIPAVSERDPDRALDSLRAALRDFLTPLCGEPCLPRRIRRTPPGLFLTFGTSGMILPVVLEAYADGALSDVAFLGTAAHELAHVAGFAREADAEVAGALAGLAAADRFARYSVALSCLGRTLRALARRDRAAAAAISDRLPPVARADLDEMRSTAARYARPRLSALQSRMHGYFLESQGVASGIRDYDRAVAILIAAMESGRLQRTP